MPPCLPKEVSPDSRRPSMTFLLERSRQKKEDEDLTLLLVPILWYWRNAIWFLVGNLQAKLNLAWVVALAREMPEAANSPVDSGALQDRVVLISA